MSRRYVFLSALAASIASIIIVFWPRLRFMQDYWSGDGPYSVAYLTPIFCAVAAYKNRKRLVEAEKHPSLAGLAALGATVVAVLLLERTAHPMYSFTPLFLAAVVSALIWTIWGTRVLRILAPAILFLQLLLPIPPLLLVPSDYLFQEVAARGLTAISHVLSIPAVRTGAAVSFGQYGVVVAPQCDGVRSVIAFTYIALFFSYLSTGAFRRRFLLVAMALPLAYLANFARLTVIGVALYKGGAWAENIEQTLDHIAGMLTFVATVALWFLIAKALKCDKIRFAQ